MTVVDQPAAVDATENAAPTYGTMMVPVDMIEVGVRHRPVRPAKVEELKQSIPEIGLLNAITVTSGYRLIAGANRLQACKELGWTEIPANITRLDDAHAELAELDENLIDSALTALEQGEHLVRREQLLTELGRRRQAGAQPMAAEINGEIKGETVSPLIGTADLAASFGMSERSAQYRKQAALKIAQDVRDMIRSTPVADSTRDLVALARMDVKQQRRIAKLIAAGARSVSAAVRPPRTRDVEEERTPRVKEVVFVGELMYTLPNPVTRMRPGGRIDPREELPVHRHVRIPIAADVIDDGLAGLLRAAKAIGTGVYNEFKESWPIPVGHAAGSAPSTVNVADDDA